MKKWMTMLALAVSVWGGFGCSAHEPTVEKAETEPGKILVAYYSWSGNTRFAAEQISKLTGGELFEIKPAEAYSSNYRTCVERAKKEIAGKIRPELAEKVKDFSRYEVIFVGTPNWGSTMAPPVRSFLSDYDFSGKTVIPFVTHGGGGMADCERDMREACPKAKFGKGGAFYGRGIRNAGTALADWINETISIRK